MSATTREFTASAPGKLLLLGEYAVLEGGTAAVMAVNRRARAQLGSAPDVTASPFLLAVRAVLESELGATSPAALAASRVAVDTNSLCAPTGEKLGLGSSGATTAAAMAACLGKAASSLDRRLLHRLAHHAHGEAQAQVSGGMRGSGVDVAASVWGGVMAIVPPATPDTPPAVRPLPLPAALELVAVWTGQPANTRQLVTRVSPLSRRDPATWRACLDELNTAAGAFIAACDRNDATAAVTALAAGGWAVAALGRAAGVELEIEAHRLLARLAEAQGGALKPTGAGGGDIALAGFVSPGQAEKFRTDVMAQGIPVLDLDVDPRGAELVPT